MSNEALRGAHLEEAVAEAGPPADCLGCRLTGTGTLLGVAVYLVHQRSAVPRANVGHRAFVLALSGCFAGGAAFRWHM